MLTNCWMHIFRLFQISFLIVCDCFEFIDWNSLFISLNFVKNYFCVSSKMPKLSKLSGTKYQLLINKFLDMKKNDKSLYNSKRRSKSFFVVCPGCREKIFSIETIRKHGLKHLALSSPSTASTLIASSSTATFKMNGDHHNHQHHFRIDQSNVAAVYNHQWMMFSRLTSDDSSSSIKRVEYFFWQKKLLARKKITRVCHVLPQIKNPESRIQKSSSYIYIGAHRPTDRPDTDEHTSITSPCIHGIFFIFRLFRFVCVCVCDKEWHCM